MASFTDKKLSEVYKDILHTDNSNTGIDSNIKQIKCGDGDTSALYLSDRNLKAQPSTDSTTNSVICDADGNALLTVDSTNDLVKAGIGQHTVNTKYAYFGIGADMQQTLVADTHYGIPFFGMTQKVEGWIADFGTGTDPDTSFTTANTLSQKGSQLAGLLWYVPDNKVINKKENKENAETS